MPRVLDSTIRQRFYLAFATAPPADRGGIIEGLQAIHMCKGSLPVETPDEAEIEAGEAA